jgi:dTDP-4-amino-4,6-dideoxygalactose transaminase
MDPCLVRYPILVADKERAVSEARRRWLEVGNWFDRPLHQASAGMEMYDYIDGMCPVAERVARQVVNLPTHPRTSEKVAREVVDLICEIGPAVAAP